MMMVPMDLAMNLLSPTGMDGVALTGGMMLQIFRTPAWVQTVKFKEQTMEQHSSLLVKVLANMQSLFQRQAPHFQQ